LRLDLSGPRNFLMLIADEINRDRVGLPVLVGDICRSYGVAIGWESSVPRGKGFLRYSKASREAPKILMSHMDKATTRGRFCVAHELAHYFLIHDCDVTPRDQREYWKIEEVCDEFARRLLLPNALVEKDFEDRGNSAQALWQLCSDYSESAWLPWIQVGVRISEFQPQAAFFTIAKIATGAFKIQSSSLADHKGRGTTLNPGTKDWQLCDALLDRFQLPPHGGPRDVSRELPSGGKLCGLLELVGASQALAEPRRGSGAHIRFVAADASVVPA
jgi:hypothetical protein